jgi:hypothetical protein
LLNAGEIEPGVVAHHWLARGTSSGKEFSFKGASIIHVEGDKIRSDEAYFDRKALEALLNPGFTSCNFTRADLISRMIKSGWIGEGWANWI